MKIQNAYFGLVLVICVLASKSTFANLVYDYHSPQRQEDIPNAMTFKQTQRLERLTSVINKNLALPETISVNAQSCGTVNAFYRDRQVSLCYELLTAYSSQYTRKFPNDPERANKTYLSEIAFIVLHEIGHAVYDVVKAPMFGNEEDAADKFAAFFLLNTGGDFVLQMAPDFLIFSKRNWVDKIASKSGDEHSYNEQRVANVVCMGLGKDPNRFSAAAAAIKLPIERARRCRNEYETMDRSVRGVLGDRLTLGRTVTDGAGNSDGGITPPNVAIPTLPVVTSPPSPQRNSSTGNGEQLVQQHRCIGCHQISDRRVGPAFREIAARYRGANVGSRLVQNVAQGSVGVWGQVPAPPMMNVPASDMQQIMNWILSL